MEKRRHLGMFVMRISMVVVGLLVTISLLLPTNPAGADNPIKECDIVTATTTLVDLETIKRPMKGNPKLESSLYQLLEVYRLKGLADAQAFALNRNMVLSDDRVQVTIVTTEQAMDDVRDAVEAVGGECKLHYRNLLQALVPIGALEVLAERPHVQFIREPRRAIPETDLPPVPMVGSETSQGVAASNASAWHLAGHDGTGVRVAVIDGGFTGYSGLLGTDLPSSVTTYDWTGTGMGDSEHGTACAEVAYDMAPGVTMDLHKVSTDVELGNAVTQVIDDGADIITMSLGWLLDGPGDGTGYLADIVNNARSNGIFYATAAGNNAEYCWSGQYVDHPSVPDTHQWPSGGNVNSFGPEPGYWWIVPEGFPIVVGLHWDDWTIVDQDYDMVLVYWNGSGWIIVGSSINIQDGTPGQTPVEHINMGAPYEGPYGIAVMRNSSTRDVCFRLIALHQSKSLSQRVSQRSVIFPGDSSDAITVGAVDVTSPYPLEYYSSQGPTFGPGGLCDGGSIKPDIAAYANVDTVSYGPGVFNGTSAATPHVGGAAALVKDANSGFTVAELQAFLETNAVDMGSPGKDNLYGSGRLFLPLNGTGQTIDLKVGWNLVSFQFEPGVTDTETVLAPIWEQFSAIWAYDAVAHKWLRWVKSGLPFLNDLNDLHCRTGYWLEMKNEASLPVNGSFCEDLIGLYEGWNLVGYRSLEIVELLVAIDPILDNLNAVWTYETEEETWLRWVKEGPPFLNDLEYIKPGKGYWLDMSATGNW